MHTHLVTPSLPPHYPQKNDIIIQIEKEQPSHEGYTLQDLQNIKTKRIQLQKRTLISRPVDKLIRSAFFGFIAGVIVDFAELLLLEAPSRELSLGQGLSILAWPWIFATIFLIKALYQQYKLNGIDDRLEATIHLLKTEEKLKTS